MNCYWQAPCSALYTPKLLKYFISIWVINLNLINQYIEYQKLMAAPTVWSISTVIKSEQELMINNVACSLPNTIQYWYLVLRHTTIFHNVFFRLDLNHSILSYTLYRVFQFHRSSGQLWILLGGTKKVWYGMVGRLNYFRVPRWMIPCDKNFAKSFLLIFFSSIKSDFKMTTQFCF